MATPEQTELQLAVKRLERSFDDFDALVVRLSDAADAVSNNYCEVRDIINEMEDE